jgi:hypothetical protein
MPGVASDARRDQSTFSHAVEYNAPGFHRATLFGKRLVWWCAVHLGHVVLAIEVETGQ